MDDVSLGVVAGVLVCLVVPFFDKINDPMSAVTVHGVCGLWGLVSVGLFKEAIE